MLIFVKAQHSGSIEFYICLLRLIVIWIKSFKSKTIKELWDY